MFSIFFGNSQDSLIKKEKFTENFIDFIISFINVLLFHVNSINFNMKWSTFNTINLILYVEDIFKATSSLWKNLVWEQAIALKRYLIEMFLFYVGRVILWKWILNNICGGRQRNVSCKNYVFYCHLANIFYKEVHL